MSTCSGCPHERGDHDRQGCAMCACSLNQHGKTPGVRVSKARADDLRSRLEALAERGRPHGPSLREIADDLTELVENLTSAAEHAESLAEAADTYENAEEGRDGADERAEAWEQAQEAAGELQAALDSIADALDVA